MNASAFAYDGNRTTSRRVRGSVPVHVSTPLGCASASPNRTTRGAGAIKKVGPRSRKRLSHDAAFFRRALELKAESRSASAGTPLVCRDSRRSLPFTAASTGKRANSRPWWEIHTFDLSADVSALRWTDCTDHAKSILAHLALCGSPDHHSFTLNLSAEVEVQARRAGKGPLDYLRRRVAEQLRRVLGQEARWWMCLEETSACRLHLHGEIECPAALLADARKALRRAGGEWKKDRQFQVVTRQRPDERWASYCSKGLMLATDWRREWMARLGCSRPWLVASFSGRAFSMSNSLRAGAKATLKELSDLVRHANHEDAVVTKRSEPGASTRPDRPRWWALALHGLLQNAATTQIIISSHNNEIYSFIDRDREFNPLSQHHPIPLKVLDLLDFQGVLRTLPLRSCGHRVVMAARGAHRCRRGPRASAVDPARPPAPRSDRRGPDRRAVPGSSEVRTPRFGAEPLSHHARAGY